MQMVDLARPKPDPGAVMPDSLFGSAGLDLTRRPESSPTPQGSGQSSYPRGTLGQAPRNADGADRLHGDFAMNERLR